jgi:hypothetical protein
MHFTTFSTVLLILLLSVTSLYAPPPGVVSHWRGDVVVATIKKVSDHEATNGKPPIIELEIHEVLRGDPKTDRTRSLWQPHPLWSGECLVGVDVKKMTEAWEVKKLASPKVGEKFILWGEMTRDKKRPQFGAYSWEAYPFSEEKRKWAAKIISEMAAETKLQEEKWTAERKAKAQALAEWRAKVTVDDLKNYTNEADLVLVGKIVSWGSSDGSGRTFFARVLKETSRPKTNSERFSIGLAGVVGVSVAPDLKNIFASAALHPEVHARLEGETDYLLFLSVEKAESQLTHFRFQPIKSGEGVVLADEKAIQAVNEALRMK